MPRKINKLRLILKDRIKKLSKVLNKVRNLKVKRENDSSHTKDFQ